jgi:hypothetical protein
LRLRVLGGTKFVGRDRCLDEARRNWDAVVDVAAYLARVAQRSVDARRESVGRHLLVSSVSVYADQSKPQVENAPVAALTNPEDTGPESSDPLQFIDVRDLADFIVRLAEDDRPETFNAIGEVVWVPSEHLLAAGLDPWMREREVELLAG